MDMSDRLLDVLCYLWLMGMIQGTLLIAMIVVFLPFGFFTKSRRFYTNLVYNSAIFNILFLIFGCVGNSAWMLLTYNRLYVSADTVVDYFPFYPFGQWALDVTFGSFKGHLIGPGTIGSLRIIWFAITCFVWCATIAMHLKLSKSLWSPPNNLLQPTSIRASLAFGPHSGG
jgi:hypothetical protein